VYSDRHTKTSGDRTYLTGVCRDNRIVRSGKAPAIVDSPPTLVRIGSHSGDDPSQMMLSLKGDGYGSAQPGAVNLSIHHAIIDGKPVSEKTNRLALLP
jgi:hypothetical protein